MQIETVRNMGTKELTLAVYDIMMEDGLSVEEADEKIDMMDREDLEEYLSYYDE